ncbi:MAG: elongation factor G [Candidatus Coatesbacteria bacterium]|nr:elongation factor G [Candidatus Coatesbacteria bacterium]
MKYNLSSVRNLGIIAHIDAGKTTFTERALFYSGRIHRIGEVDEGSASMDWMDQERERGITITSAATSFEWQNSYINLIDTPGHVDFTVEVERSLRILDGAIVIFCAVEGVEPQSEAVWHRADKYNLPRIVFVNKMDRMGADFFSVLQLMSKRLDANPVPVQIPVGAETEFVGVIDLLEMKMLRWDQKDSGKTLTVDVIPKTKRKLAQRYRDRLVEAVACTDEALLEKVTGDPESVTPEMLKRALRVAVMRSELVPVYCGSALRNTGVQPVLDAAVEFFPSPADRPPVMRENLLTHKDVEVKPDPNDPCALLVFKVMHLHDSSKVWYCRIYSGTIQEGDVLYNSSRKTAERISSVLRILGAKKEKLKIAKAGEIVGLVGLKNTFTGDTLCSSIRPVVLEAMDFPEPVVSMAIEPKSQDDLKKMFASLTQLKVEDPTFRVKENKETGQTIISGMGELHLEVLVERLKRDFRVQTRTGQPQVAYKEGIRQQGTGTGTFTKTSGSSSQHVTVTMTVKPAPRGRGLIVESDADLDLRSTGRFGSIKKACENTMSAGVLMGYPMIDVWVTVDSVDEENVDRIEQAYYVAGASAFKNALKDAHPMLLEPIMKGEIMTPREYSSRVIEGLGMRGAKINEITTRGPLQIIAVNIPLSSTFGLATQLRSETQGRASYMMDLSHYTEVKSKGQDAF